MDAPSSSPTDGSEPPGPVLARSVGACDVLEQVRTLSEGARRAALDRVCGADLSLHAQVVALLTLEQHPSLDLRPAPTEAVAATHSRNAEPEPHGPLAGFRIVRLLGVGGAGVVYEAEQVRPRRAVALKLFAARRTDAAFRRRIAREAEVLARLHHPGIAQVLAADDGEGRGGDLPWIAMELVRGTRIDAWCRERAAGLRDRVELLATVAEAVAHAHACGVVHRDLKPSNVLVTDAGVPKVLDFGLAKTLDVGAGGGSLHTRDGELVGTLAYMALEQAQGAATLVDTRTDVHALGVLGYELLTGRLPRDPAGLSLPGWAQELARPAPSIRAALPSAPLDLALIVAKALEADRDRRYATAQAFADDLRRFLAGLPVHARAPTPGYLLRAFVRRHRALVGSALATVLALAVGLVVALRFGLESEAQRRRADVESVEARREAYRARTSVAAEALAAGNAFGARDALDRAPEPFRGWEWRHLDAQVDRAARVVTYAQPLERWHCVAADGSAVAGGGPDGSALVIEAATGRVLRRVPGTPAVERGALTADGGRLVLAREGGTLEVLDLRSGASVSLGGVPGRTAACDALCASPTGARIAESRPRADGRLRIVDLDGGAEQRRDTPDTWTFTCLAFDGRGERLVGTLGHGGVLEVDLRHDGPARWLGSHAGAALAAAYAADGAAVVSGGADRSLLRHDGSGRSPATLALHQQAVLAVAASPDGRLLATWSRERMLRLFGVGDGRTVATFASLGGAEEVVLRFPPDGRSLEAFERSACRSWYTTTLTRFDLLLGHRGSEQGNPYPYLYDVAFSPDGTRLATAGWDGAVRVVDARTLEPVAVLEAPGPVQAIAFSPDGERLVTSGRPHHLCLFEVASGRRLATASDGVPEMDGGVAFSPDGLHVVGTHTGRILALRDPLTLRASAPLEPTPRVTYAVTTGAAGTLVGYGDGGWSWIARDGARRDLPAHRLGIVHVALSTDGRWAASASEDGTARLVDLSDGTLRAEIRGHVGRVYAVAFAPDGRRLATGGDDGTVRLHDTETGAEVLVLRGHSSYVYALAFSPDGHEIASASGDNTARLWSTRPLAERVARAGVGADLLAPDPRSER